MVDGAAVVVAGTGGGPSPPADVAMARTPTRKIATHAPVAARRLAGATDDARRPRGAVPAGGAATGVATVGAMSPSVVAWVRLALSAASRAARSARWSVIVVVVVAATVVVATVVVPVAAVVVVVSVLVVVVVAVGDGGRSGRRRRRADGRHCRCG